MAYTYDQAKRKAYTKYINSGNDFFVVKADYEGFDVASEEDIETFYAGETIYYAASDEVEKSPEFNSYRAFIHGDGDNGRESNYHTAAYHG